MSMKLHDRAPGFQLEVLRKGEKPKPSFSGPCLKPWFHWENERTALSFRNTRWRPFIHIAVYLCPMETISYVEVPLPSIMYRNVIGIYMSRLGNSEVRKLLAFVQPLRLIKFNKAPEIIKALGCSWFAFVSPSIAQNVCQDMDGIVYEVVGNIRWSDWVMFGEGPPLPIPGW